LTYSVMRRQGVPAICTIHAGTRHSAGDGEDGGGASGGGAGADTSEVAPNSTDVLRRSR